MQSIAQCHVDVITQLPPAERRKAGLLVDARGFEQRHEFGVCEEG